jgi:DNA-binding NarL/FixJ family response regulator
MMKILLADDHTEVRSAIRLLLEEDTSNWLVEAEACDYQSLLDAVLSAQFELLLLDWELPGLQEGRKGNPSSNGTELAQIRALQPGIKIVVLSGRMEARAEAARAGADAFVSKGDPADVLLSNLSALVSVKRSP